MSTIFNSLCEFFGLSSAAPATFGDLLPWLLQIVIAFCLVWAIFRMFRSVTAAIFSGGRRI